MATWRCPHCGAPQPESARCWVCKRSSTTCGTCRQYRRAVAGQLGYCAISGRRTVLTGEEMKGCWESGSEDYRPPATAPWASRVVPSNDERRSRVGFVPLGDLEPMPGVPRVRQLLWEDVEG